jgi:hypothetical protein
MGVSMIRQKLGNKVFTNYVPADDTNAKEFADNVMVGEYDILTKISENGSDNVTESMKWTLMLRNDETHEKTYLNFYSPISKDENDIREALLSKTFNGVKVDSVVVIGARSYKFGDK